MNTYVFLGPTLSLNEAKSCLDAVYCDPVQQGDIVRVLDRRAEAIGIIDGFFEVVPSVWHKEILLALSRGVYVCGAASMGALRAAELARYGMVGIGTVFEWYRDGVIEEDDEVVVRHLNAESGYRPTSEAMVSIRQFLNEAAAEGVIPPAVMDYLTAVAKRLPYWERSYRSILAIAREELGSYEGEEALARRVAEQRPTIKQRDAIALLTHLASGPPPELVGKSTFELQYTVFLESLLAEARKCFTASTR